METNDFLATITEFPARVLILPMRNGNGISIPVVSVKILGSYPTYEEWKLYTYFLTYINLYFPVLILPMRNGNPCISKSISSSNSCSYPTYEEWKRYNELFLYFLFIYTFLSYLWGMETFFLLSIFSPLYKEFLSYLWGMETTITWWIPLILRS